MELITAYFRIKTHKQIPIVSFPADFSDPERLTSTTPPMLAKKEEMQNVTRTQEFLYKKQIKEKNKYTVLSLGIFS